MRKTVKDTISFLKEHYKPGMRLRLLSMDDPQAPKVGTEGTVRGVDDMGNILMRWDTGSSLSLIPEADKFEEVL